MNMPASPVDAEEPGFLGAILSVDQPASGTLTGELLGGNPCSPAYSRISSRAITSTGI
jgi:hypothetical protein